MPDWIWLQELLSVGSRETMVALFSTGHFPMCSLCVFTVVALWLFSTVRFHCEVCV